MLKVLYKPFGMVAGVLGGLVASRLFSAAWKALGHEDEAPSSTDARRGWGEVLLAATVEGAIYGLVKAATDRSAATGFERATGAWPGEGAEAAA